MVDGRVTEIGVEWRYDPFTSMLILADLGLNPAAHALDPEELVLLQGFDLNWQDGYEGDLYVYAGDERLELSPPRPGPAWLDDGQIVTSHVRALLVPTPPPLVLRVYDPEYYIAYTLQDPRLDPAPGCIGRVMVPDRIAAQERVEALLDELYAGDFDPEENFPMVGAQFADELHLICD